MDGIFAGTFKTRPLPPSLNDANVLAFNDNYARIKVKGECDKWLPKEPNSETRVSRLWRGRFFIRVQKKFWLCSPGWKEGCWRASCRTCAETVDSQASSQGCHRNAECLQTSNSYIKYTHNVITVTQKFVHHKINLPENDVTPISRREEHIITTWKRLENFPWQRLTGEDVVTTHIFISDDIGKANDHRRQRRAAFARRDLSSAVATTLPSVAERVESIHLTKPPHRLNSASQPRQKQDRLKAVLIWASESQLQASYMYTSLGHVTATCLWCGDVIFASWEEFSAALSMYSDINAMQCRRPDYLPGKTELIYNVAWL